MSHWHRPGQCKTGWADWTRGCIIDTLLSTDTCFCFVCPMFVVCNVTLGHTVHWTHINWVGPPPPLPSRHRAVARDASWDTTHWSAEGLASLLLDSTLPLSLLCVCTHCCSNTPPPIMNEQW